MRTFKEFPCVVFILTRNYTIKKLDLVKPYNSWSISSGCTAKGQAYAARDCHLTFKAALLAGKKQIARRAKNLIRAQQDLDKDEARLVKAEQAFNEKARKK